ncbi:UNKNOWN [Stylonychia lemnae]|uniref:Uncharacterized protein n=1 Tax=Stylonychia lemnae TaxID=5949 RepID=A0A078A683_STYLE|nr:UNKNOWN [Stylonychia lemnae]|eukprot:CDW77714.1 UNKNOWN [Stylonychia lemnae]
MIQALNQTLRDHEKELKIDDYEVENKLRRHYCVRCKVLRHCVHCCVSFLGKRALDDQFCNACREYGHKDRCCQLIWDIIRKKNMRKVCVDGCQIPQGDLWTNYDEPEFDIETKRIQDSFDLAEKLTQMSIRDKNKNQVKKLNSKIIKKLKEINEAYYNKLLLCQTSPDPAQIQFIYQGISMYLTQYPELRLHFTLLETNLEFKQQMINILQNTKGVGSVYLDPIDQKYKALWLSKVKLGMSTQFSSENNGQGSSSNGGISSGGAGVEQFNIDSSDENYVSNSSTGASGNAGGSSRPSSEWALRDNKDIKADEVRVQEVAERVQEHWIYKREKHFNYYFYLDY